LARKGREDCAIDGRCECRITDRMKQRPRGWISDLEVDVDGGRNEIWIFDETGAKGKTLTL